jgi:hypothetical protein
MIVYSKEEFAIVAIIHSERTETLIDASEGLGLEVNSPSQNRGIKTANICFENVAQFKYLGTTVTNKNVIQEEINM